MKEEVLVATISFGECEGESDQLNRLLRIPDS